MNTHSGMVPLQIAGHDVRDPVGDEAAHEHEAVDHSEDLEEVVEQAGTVLVEEQRDRAQVDEEAEEGEEQDHVAEESHAVCQDSGEEHGN